MTFEALVEFNKDLKKLLKKYRSLKEDLAVVKQVLRVLPGERPPFSYRINDLGIETCVIKVKKIACKSLKGKGVNSGLRLVYAHFKAKKKEEDGQESKERIVFVEIYHKKEKEIENRKRIQKYFE